MDKRKFDHVYILNDYTGGTLFLLLWENIKPTLFVNKEMVVGLSYAMCLLMN